MIFPSGHWTARNQVSAGRSWGLREYAVILGGAPLGPAATTMAVHVDHAKRTLAQDFIVGVSEKLESFIALAALTLGWPVEVVCLPLQHTRSVQWNSSNSKEREERGKRGHFYRQQVPEAMTLELARLLADEISIYDFAASLHEAQLHSAEGIGDYLRAVTSPLFQRTCEERRPETDDFEHKTHVAKRAKDQDLREYCSRFRAAGG